MGERHPALHFFQDDLGCLVISIEMFFGIAEADFLSLLNVLFIVISYLDGLDSDLSNYQYYQGYKYNFA